MLDLVWTIPLLPLAAALWCGLDGKRLGEKAGLVACGGIFSAFIATLCLFIYTTSMRSIGIDPFPHQVQLFTWMEVAGTSVAMGFLVDELTMVMLLTVTLLGSLIFNYARGYMHGDPGIARFFAYLSLFAFSMLILVMADNFLLMFVGWEGVGLCSYLLIGYYFKEGWCADAGKKAFIANRIGDFGFLLASFLIFYSFGSFDFYTVLHAAEADALSANPAIAAGVFTAITFCLLIAATGKSAQIPLYVWLPDAMAGPTPVSALIHAATMVTAGIYMIVRTNVLFVLSPMTMTIVAAVGAGTAILAALIACTQHDIKKVLAYSTVSQLGYMFLALGVGAFGAAMFHVFTHAFFKGCLFLCAGSVIHAMHHEQDMRKMGGLKDKMPITAATYFISTLAIAGIPGLSGFFSKDEILWMTVGQGHYLLWLVGAVTALLTAFYMFRSYYMTFEGEPRADEETWSHTHESPSVMTMPLIVLAFGAVAVGALGIPHWLAHLPLMHGFEPHTLIFQRYISPIADMGNHLLEARGLHALHPPKGLYTMELIFALISSGIAIGGYLIAKFLYGGKDSSAGDAKVSAIPGYAVAQAKFYVDEVYETAFISRVGQGAKGATAADKNFIDGSISWVIGKTREMASAIQSLQTGHLQVYAAAFMLGLILFLATVW